MTRPFLLALALVAAAFGVHSAPFQRLEECASGVKVVDREGKSGVVIAASDGLCRVRLDEGGKEVGYAHWHLRPASDEQAGAGKLVPGTYECFSSADGTLDYTFVDIVIDGPASYRDKSGRRGNYRLEASTGGIVFESGPFRKARARLLPGGRIGINLAGAEALDTTCTLSSRGQPVEVGRPPKKKQ